MTLCLALLPYCLKNFLVVVVAGAVVLEVVAVAVVVVVVAGKASSIYWPRSQTNRHDY